MATSLKSHFFATLLVLTFTIVQSQAPPGSLPQSDVRPLVSDLISQGFSICAAVVQPMSNVIQKRSTLLLPTNEAITAFNSNLSQADILRTLQYHVITYPTSFRALSRKNVGAQLPTMLQDAFVTVTSNTPGNFTLNGVNVTHPDVCQSTQFVACHGIDKVLTYTVNLASAPQPAAAPVEGTNSEAPTDAVGGGGSSLLSPPGSTNSNSKLSGASKYSSSAKFVLAGLLGSFLFM